MKSKHIRWSFQFLTALLVGFLFLKIFYTASENKNLGYDQKPRNSTYGLFQSCNLFMGKWVYDNESYPHYRDRECSFMDDGMACEKFGRKDLNYQHWRWQPHDCDLPRSLSLSLNLLRSIYVLSYLNCSRFHSSSWLLYLIRKSNSPRRVFLIGITMFAEWFGVDVLCLSLNLLCILICDEFVPLLFSFCFELAQLQ